MFIRVLWFLPYPRLPWGTHTLLRSLNKLITTCWPWRVIPCCRVRWLVIGNLFRARIALNCYAGADVAYKHVGLIQHETERKRYVKKGIFLGAQIDGEAGLISAPLHRIGVLTLLTSIGDEGMCLSCPAVLSAGTLDSCLDVPSAAVSCPESATP